ncbi:MAG: hypothetical protein WC773_00685 [Patescibacteria group bacterium]|jgi:hypothetical protein
MKSPEGQTSIDFDRVEKDHTTNQKAELLKLDHKDREELLRLLDEHFDGKTGICSNCYTLQDVPADYKCVDCDHHASELTLGFLTDDLHYEAVINQNLETLTDLLPQVYEANGFGAEEAA